jgi:sulfide:quinone oxidoreductase
MTTVVVVGGGVAGLVAARRLRRWLPSDAHVVVVDRAATHVFQPSLLWVADGSRDAQRIARPLDRLARHGIEYRRAAVTGVDVARRALATDAGPIPYDYLILAPGAELRPDALPGLAAAGHNLYTGDGALAIAAALRQWQGGRIVVLVGGMPFKCPAAPYEAAMLIEAYVRRRGLRARTDITLATPEPQPMPVAGPVLGAAVRDLLAERDLAYLPGHTAVAVDGAARRIDFAAGATAPYDLLVYVPPHAPPAWLAGSGVTRPDGWVQVDARTLATPADRVWAAGDVTAIPLANGKLLPKAGVFAERQAEAVARNVAALVRGATPAATFDGYGECFVEIGRSRAGFASGDFYAVPDPAVRLRRPGRRWHWAKVWFERTWFPRWL